MQIVSSAVGEKVRKRVIPPNGRISPPEMRSASLSLSVSQRTDQNLVCMVLFGISLNRKLSASSSMVEEYALGFVVPFLCRHWRAHATRISSPLAVSSGSPSKPEWRMPSAWVRMSMAMKSEAQASQSAYLGAESCVGSKMRHVVTHRSSFALLPRWGLGGSGP